MSSLSEPRPRPPNQTAHFAAATFASTVTDAATPAPIPPGLAARGGGFLIGVLVVDVAELFNFAAVGLFGSTLVAGALVFVGLVMTTLTGEVEVAPFGLRIPFAVPVFTGLVAVPLALVEAAAPFAPMPGAWLTITTPVLPLVAPIAVVAAVAALAIGFASPTIVALLRFGCGHPSGGVAGADLTNEPFGGCCAVGAALVVVDVRRCPVGADDERAVRFGVDLEFAAEDLAS